jgi:hypothetical protein
MATKQAVKPKRPAPKAKRAVAKRARPAKKARKAISKRRGNPVYNFRLEPDQIQALREEAESRGLTVSDLLRESISPVFDRRLNQKREVKEVLTV